MRLRALIATAHPEGHRIDLRWTNPDPAGHPSVRVVRRTRTYPATPDDGTVVADGELLGVGDETGARRHALVDRGLPGETVFYYALFPYSDAADLDGAEADPQNRAAAAATSARDAAGRMYTLMPAIYRRYDADLAKRGPAALAPEDAGKGPLRRFFDITGGPLDQLHSAARMLLDAHDVERIDGRLLDLLADWIGWSTNHRIPIGTQRNELRQAPHVYKTIGIIPTVEATVKRILGWESRIKEFVHNVARTNHPPRLNLWMRTRQPDGKWPEPSDPLSLDAAYEGRPTAVTDTGGTTWLFYHTRRGQTWDLWCKTHEPAGEWSPSRPLIRRARLDRHPSAAIQDGSIFLFWDSYAEGEGWRVETCVREGDAWSEAAPVFDDAVERRRPFAVAGAGGGLWLFWQEKAAGRWRPRYARRAAPGSAFTAAADFPASGTAADPGADLFVLAHPDDAAQPLWAFWARTVPVGTPGATRREVAYRVKASLDPAAADWGPVRTLPAGPPDASGNEPDDREPAAAVDDAGDVELYWSATRDRSFSLWGAVIDRAAHTLSEPEALTENPLNQRAPLPLRFDGAMRLLYRSDESLTYHSAVYGATRTVDNRYAGTTTVDARNRARNALHGTFADTLSYTYDTGEGGVRGDLDWYAVDTVGIYATPETEDPTLILRNRRIIEQVLRQFLPAQVRAVLVIEPSPYRELVYTYDFPEAEPQRPIGEQVFDQVLPETYAGVTDSYADLAPDWVWMRAWSEATPDHRTVDFAGDPPDVSHRTWHIGLEAGG